MPETSRSFRMTDGPPKYRGHTLEEILAMPSGRDYLARISRGQFRSEAMDRIREFLAEHPETAVSIPWLDERPDAA